MESIVVIVSDVVVISLHESALVIEAVVVLNIMLVSHMLLIGVFEIHQPRTDSLETVVIIVSDVVVIALYEGAFVIEAIVVLHIVLVGHMLLIGVCEVHQDDWLISQVVQVDQLEGLVSSNRVGESLQIVNVAIDGVSVDVINSRHVVVVSLFIFKMSLLMIVKVIVVRLVCGRSGRSRAGTHDCFY